MGGGGQLRLVSECIQGHEVNTNLTHEALRLYRAARAGLLGCEPAHFFDAKHDSNWLC